MTPPLAPTPPSPSATADPKGAQAHARAMAGTRVQTMPTLPASHSATLPVGVDAAAMLWEEVIAPGGYSAKRLDRGARVRLTDLDGDGCVGIQLFNAETPIERLNIADTLKVQWNAYLKPGSLLLSDMGRVMMSLLEDDAGTHDGFCGVSNAASNAARYGSGDNWGPCPNTRDRFLLAAAKFGLGRKDIHPCLSWFKGVRIDADGTVRPQLGPFVAGRSVLLRVEMPLIVIFANCPHPLDPRSDYRVSPVQVQAWRGAVTPPDDPVRCASPEGLRAFLNLEDYFAR
jgi:urea carboxylase-associated protein 2